MTAIKHPRNGYIGILVLIIIGFIGAAIEVCFNQVNALTNQLASILAPITDEGQAEYKHANH